MVRLLRKIILASLFGCFLLSACKSKIEYKLPKTLDDGWSVSNPVDYGFNQSNLIRIVENIPSQNPKLDGIVIVKNGKLIVDQYYNDYSSDRLHKVWSITKVVTGTTLGIAIDHKLLSINDSITHHLENYKTKNNRYLDSINIKHLITMTSGIEWVELGGPQSSGFKLPYSNDWIRFILNRPKQHPAGQVFNYSTGNSILLAPILKKSTGIYAAAFAKQHLFDPLNIQNYQWDSQKEFWTKTQSGELPGAIIPTNNETDNPPLDYTNTGSGLHMRLRDIAKIGQLYLNDGKWQGNQIVSKSWVNESIQPHTKNGDYGYHWRLMTINDETCYYATGFGLQGLYVFPRLDLVIALSQQHYQTMPKGQVMTDKLITSILKTVVK